MKKIFTTIAFSLLTIIPLASCGKKEDLKVKESAKVEVYDQDIFSENYHQPNKTVGFWDYKEYLPEIAQGKEQISLNDELDINYEGNYIRRIYAGASDSEEKVTPDKNGISIINNRKYHTVLVNRIDAGRVISSVTKDVIKLNPNHLPKKIKLIIKISGDISGKEGRIFSEENPGWHFTELGNVFVDSWNCNSRFYELKKHDRYFTMENWADLNRVIALGAIITSEKGEWLTGFRFVNNYPSPYNYDFDFSYYKKTEHPNAITLEGAIFEY